METLRNKRKHAAVNKENCEELLRSNLAQHTNVPRSQEEFIIQVAEESEKERKKLSPEVIRTESRILGKLSQFDNFPQSPLIQGESGSAPETSCNPLLTKQGKIEDESQNDPHHEGGVSRSQTTLNFGSDDTYDMVTGVDEELTYCYFVTCSGKKEENRAASQPTIHSENTPAMTEADQIFLVLQQLAINSTTANFNSHIHRISNLPKSLTTTMPTFNGEIREVWAVCRLFPIRSQTPQPADWNRQNQLLHSPMKGDELQRFENINGPTRENLGETLVVFCRKHVKPNRRQWQNINSRNLFQPRRSKVSWSSWWTSKASLRLIRNSCSCYHRTIHICQNATTPEEINKPGPVEKWHVWTDCHTPRKGIRAEWFRSCWRTTDKHCDPSCGKHGCCQTQLNVPPLQKAWTSHRLVSLVELKRQQDLAEGTQTNPSNKNSGANKYIPNNSNNNNNYTNNNENFNNKAERKPEIVYPLCDSVKYATDRIPP